ncbi:MAG: hypothetical protein NZ959_07955 [Armatimonadetes bacterium]|nr:hypothetical protein [Armatimonadota bacterium]MDW8122901.1 hypothetical protein [Armatimonadota bacterium]
MNDQKALLLIIYDRAVEMDLMSRLEELNLDGYTQIRDAEGKGGQGLKKGDPIFPGLNNILLIALEEADVPHLVAILRQLQSEYVLKPGITIFQLSAKIL